MLNNHAQVVLADRYSIDSEDFETVCRRIGHGISKAEAPEKQNDFVEYFAEIIYNLQFLPAGRIFRGAGRPQANLLNCFVLDIDDSMKSIGDTLCKMWEISSEGGGVGVNFSKIRPSGEELNRKGGVASGPVSFMSVFDVAAHVICSGGARRAALKGDLNISHPDILKFISAKLDNQQLTNFNISVGLTNQFLNSVRGRESWELRFGGRVHEEIPAEVLWEQIMGYAVSCGEPGFIHSDNLAINNSYYFNPIISTNPCGELPLEAFGSCCLGHINLARFVSSGGRTKWKEMGRVIELAIRFLDNVIEINNYFLPECKEVAFKGRRIGLGFLGLADYFFQKGIRYGSGKSIEELDALGAFIRNMSYAASIDLAEEKGAFNAFDRDLHSKAKFIRRLPRYLQRRIYEKGIRNVTLNTVAPTGTVHQLAGVTSGCEPLFSKAYIRRDKVGESYHVHEGYANFLKQKEENNGRTKKKAPKWYVDAFDITPFEHLEVQSTLQRYIDGSISKTINCPAGTTAEDLSKLILKYIDDLKGLTIYVDQSREEQILYPMTEEEAIECLKKEIKVSDAGDTECITGVCEA